jgi:hypothetical protein
LIISDIISDIIIDNYLVEQSSWLQSFTFDYSSIKGTLAPFFTAILTILSNQSYNSATETVESVLPAGTCIQTCDGSKKPVHL